MTNHAKGNFEVQMTPLDQDEQTKSASPGRMLLDKQFIGDLIATSQGHMLTALTTTKGSAGYVAIEQVTGTLHGHSGSFVLQHSGIMNRGEQHLTIIIVPDSGTDELVGLSGTMSISIDENGKHTYDLRYELPEG